MSATWDRRSTESLNQLNRMPRVSRFFGIVSRLGDGVFWYVLLGMLPLCAGMEGLWTSLVTLLAGASCTVLYKALKRATARPRPCEVVDGLTITMAPLDRFSFPSGHTLHALCFTMMLVHFEPWLGIVLYPFTVCVALSRLVLGLHYVTDVIAGAVIGSAVAMVAIPYL